MICGKMPVNQTDKYISDLESEIQYLKKLLDENGISYDYEAHLRTLQSDVGDVVLPELGSEHASLLYSYFKGRRDVYALRARNGQGYYTQCNHFWKTGICPKKSGVKIKCQDCPSRDYTELRGKVILEHLKGESPRPLSDRPAEVRVRMQYPILQKDMHPLHRTPQDG